MNPAFPKPPRLAELDALKGLAVLGVLLTHYTMESKALHGLGFRFGSMGVELLFLIAGFTATASFTYASSLKELFIKKLYRVLPVYWASVSLTALSIWFWMSLGEPHVFHQSHLYHGNLLVQWLANLTLLQQYLRVLDMDTDYWTLTVGLLFYAYLGLLHALGQFRRAERISLLLLAPVLAYGLFLKSALPMAHKLLTYFLPLVNHFPLFFAGLLLFRMRSEGATPARYAMLLLCFALQPLLLDDGGWTWVFVSLSDYVLGLAVLLLLCVLLLRGGLGWIVNPLTRFLGQIAFPLYLTHQVIGFYVLMRWLEKYQGMNPWVAIFGIALPGVLLLSWLLHRGIEARFAGRG